MATPNFTRLFSNSGLLSTGMKSTMLVLLLALLLVGCGGITPPVTSDLQPRPTPTPVPVTTPAPTPTPAPSVYFNSSMIGQKWTFVNGYGDHTFIDVQAAPAGSQAQVVWHYTKDNCRAYWNPGDCTSVLWFGITENPDRSWSATQFLVTCDACIGSSTQGSATIKPTAPGGYLVIPPPQAAFTTGNTGYVPCWQLDVLSWVPDNCNIIGATPISWVTEGFMDNISTPAYSGPVLVAKQAENCPDTCTIELWYFAPNLGLVQVVQLQSSNVVDDPSLAMQRILN
jgi:hypothetical protein